MISVYFDLLSGLAFLAAIVSGVAFIMTGGTIFVGLTIVGVLIGVVCLMFAYHFGDK